jgi:hypothetical protein
VVDDHFHLTPQLPTKCTPSKIQILKSEETPRRKVSVGRVDKWSTTCRPTFTPARVGEFRSARRILFSEGFLPISRFVFCWGTTWSAAEVKVVVGLKWSSGRYF